LGSSDANARLMTTAPIRTVRTVVWVSSVWIICSFPLQPVTLIASALLVAVILFVPFW
jgi:hypothetical protein